MALTKEDKKAGVPGKFEEASTPGAATATAEPPRANDAQVADAGVKAATAIASAAASAKTSLAVPPTGSLAAAIKSENLLMQMRDAMPPVEFGTFPRLVGASGTVKNKSDNGAILGEWIDLQLLSWNETFVVSPGTDNEEAKKHVRYSRDGNTIDETGESVADYLKRLREVEGYDKAAKKPYIDLVGLLERSAKGVGPVGELVTVSLSKQSLKTFQAYMATVAVKMRLGQLTGEGIDKIRVTAVPKSGGGKDWTELHVTKAPAQ